MTGVQKYQGSHAIVVGGGFGGIAAAKELAKFGVRVTLIDRNPYQTFQPMLYQVATAIVSPGDIAYPLQNLAKTRDSLTFLEGEVVGIDPSSKTVTLADGATLDADYLVIAAGARANFFGVPGAQEHTYPMYTLHDANQLRSQIVNTLRTAAHDPANIDEAALRFVIVGAGPTGVETAGHMADLFGYAVKKEFPELKGAPLKITMIDSGPAPLQAFNTKSQRYTVKHLKKLGVEQIYDTQVKRVNADSIELSNGLTINTNTVVWAGGSQASELARKSGLPSGEGGRIDVDAQAQVEGFAGVYALGDIVNMPSRDGETFPSLGAVAQQQGTAVGRNIARDIAGKQAKDFRYLDKGTMAIIARRAAVAQIGPTNTTLEGPIAFAAWLGVHLYLLEGVRQKAGALSAWAWEIFVNQSCQIRATEAGTPMISWPADDPSVAQLEAKQKTKTSF